ncbi:MarR family winged helix-turn-helix transcriptional regulator [Marinobacter sp. 1Y8]
MHPLSLSEPLHRLTHAYKSGLRRAIRESQITLPITHIRALKRINAVTDCTAQSIVQHTQRDKAQITRVLNELLANGLIIKSDNPNDRRSQLLKLTPSGDQVLKQIQALEKETTALMTKGMKQTDVELFVRLANTLADNLSGDSPKHPIQQEDA